MEVFKEMLRHDSILQFMKSRDHYPYEKQKLKMEIMKEYVALGPKLFNRLQLN